MDRKYLRKEWNMLSDAMVKIFSTKTSGWNGIPSYIRKLTHSMVYGYKVNVELHNGMRLQYTKHMSDHVSNLGSSFTDDLVIFSLEDEARVDPTQANPHSSKYIPFRPSRQPKSLQKAQTVSEKRTIEADEEDSENVEGETAQVAANKDGVVKEPTVQQSYLLSTSYLLSGLHSLSPMHTVVFTQTDNIVSTNLVVTPLQHPHPDVIIEDKSKHVPIMYLSLLRLKSVAEGFSKIRAALESFPTLLHAANLPKGEKYDISYKGNNDQTSGEPQGRASEKELGELVLVHLVLTSVTLAEEMKRSESVSRTVLPPVTIREPAFGSSALDRRFRHREEEIAKGKGKQKLVEYADIFNAYGDGEEFDLVQATVIMVNDNESKQQFEKLIHDAKAGIGNRLMNWSDKIREQVADFCVIVNEKHRWFVYVYMKNQYTLYFTMECLQLQATIVLFSLLSTMMKKEIPVNQILNITHSNDINEKALEIYMNPFSIYYRMKSENSDKFGVVNLNETRMGLPGNKYVLKKILASAINAERNSAVQI
ncbi:hypothetical protein ACET3Z_005065 [Daucus carota]